MICDATMAKKIFGSPGGPAGTPTLILRQAQYEAVRGQRRILILSLSKDEAAALAEPGPGYALRRLFSGSQGLSGITTAGYFLPRISILSSVPIAATSGFT